MPKGMARCRGTTDCFAVSFAVAWDLMFGIAFATRDGIAGTLHYTSTVLNSHFTVANTVVNGINKKPGQFTGGEGPATGQKVLIQCHSQPTDRA
jgi:hypothetical protein